MSSGKPKALPTCMRTGASRAATLAKTAATAATSVALVMSMPDPGRCSFTPTIPGRSRQRSISATALPNSGLIPQKPINRARCFATSAATKLFSGAMFESSVMPTGTPM